MPAFDQHECISGSPGSFQFECTRTGNRYCKWKEVLTTNSGYLALLTSSLCSRFLSHSMSPSTLFYSLHALRTLLLHLVQAHFEGGHQIRHRLHFLGLLDGFHLFAFESRLDQFLEVILKRVVILFRLKLCRQGLN